MACWDLPPTPLCKDKLKVVGASKFSLQSKELGPKRGQDLLKSLTNQRLSSPHPPVTPTMGTKARLEPAPDPWVILGWSGLSPGLCVPGVIDTRTGRAQPLTHPPPPTCQQDCPSRGQTCRGSPRPTFLSQRWLSSWKEAAQREGPAQVLYAGLISSAPATGRGSPRCQDSGTVPSDQPRHSREHRASGRLSPPPPPPPTVPPSAQQGQEW